MIAVLDEHWDDVDALCGRFVVRRLDVFESTASGKFNATRSDIDVPVGLDPPTDTSRFDAFLGVKQAGRPISSTRHHSTIRTSRPRLTTSGRRCMQRDPRTHTWAARRGAGAVTDFMTLGDLS